ncbi:MAG: LssY C-terminal domain-containing protein [Pirellulales bacterium]|nr:LssY C-terminal domain-containing protein [Pirellulales bacterium]
MLDATGQGGYRSSDMSLEETPILRRLLVPYRPRPTARTFDARAQTQSQDGLDITVAVLDSKESRHYFGVPMARRGIQPLWLRVVNRAEGPYRVNLVGIDPNYFSAHEASAANHFSSGKRILGFGAAALLVFFPLIWLLPFKLFGAWRANRQMDDYFHEHAFRLRPVEPGETSEGFVFTSLDIGNKIIHVRLLGIEDTREFVFSVPVPGLDADYARRAFQDLYPAEQQIECDELSLGHHLAEAPATTLNGRGTRFGDPVNLVIVGEFPTVVSAFGARWDETEVITLATCWKTARAFLTGSEYRYSPVSPLHLYGRIQDFALQRVRKSINERLHMRLWATPLRLGGQPVWVGQVSRDMGVRLTWRTWNLTTHRIDPDIDEARDYVLEDLFQAGRLKLAGYVTRQDAVPGEIRRRNLTGDPYFTDGKLAVMVVSPTRTTARFVAWE